jgi:HEAT repeat protein
LDEILKRRNLKQKVFELLKLPDLEEGLEELRKMPVHQAINSLTSFLSQAEGEIKWRAVTAMGVIVADLADKNIEKARNIMRRLMWSLNDESGSIGWGAPEAMGEIMAFNEKLAKEYAHILISYIRENGNYLEHELLQQGVIWGIGRVAQVRPKLIKDAVPYLKPFLISEDALIRGLAVWIMGLLGIKEVSTQIENLLEDHTEVHLYLNHKLLCLRVSDLAREASKSLYLPGHPCQDAGESLGNGAQKTSQLAF